MKSDLTGWEVLTRVRKYDSDIDWYRNKYHKNEAEQLFFHQNKPVETIERRGNILTYLGASSIWGLLTNLNSLTNFSHSNCYVGVGDGGATVGSGTITATSGSQIVTFSTSQSSLLGYYIAIANDTSVGIYKIGGSLASTTGNVTVTNGSATITFASNQTIVAGTQIVVLNDSSNGIYTLKTSISSSTTGTLTTAYEGATGAGNTWYIVSTGSSVNWLISPLFQGSTTSGGSWSSVLGEQPNQTTLQGSTNKVIQQVDAGFPTYTDGNAPITITAATNASPIVITAASHGYSTGQFVSVEQVMGNTAANGLWQVTVVDSNDFSLNGSVGNANYLAEGFSCQNNIINFQSTFGFGTANFPWYEWEIRNGSSDSIGRMLNRKVTSIGTKPYYMSWTFEVAIATG